MQKVTISYLYSESWEKFMRFENKRSGNEERPNFHHHVQSEKLFVGSPKVRLNIIQLLGSQEF